MWKAAMRRDKQWKAAVAPAPAQPRMNRRGFLGTAGLAGILAAGAAPAVQASQAVRWRLASSYTKSLDIALGGAYAFARRVKELSAGRIDIAVSPADELLPAFGIFEGVQKGQVECGHTSPHYYLEKEPAFALDGSIPFGLDARQLNAWREEGGGNALLQELYRAHGIVGFPLGNTGVQMGGWFRRLVRSPADLKGLRMRIIGLGAQIMQHLGVQTVALPSAEIYKAIEQNRLDAAEWVGPYDDLRLGLHKLFKYYAYPGWWETGTQRALYINQRAYDALSNENKAIIE
ncbi:MAG: twin-arginine translocation signal domain-containing protein, partial [Rhodocyclaceae bacterium]|nr:twin-arginine translocation signal domain-containing protein [Rhodocyclaceae bacterium]